MSSAKPSEEQVEELLLSCRYGDLEDVKAFVQQYGVDPVQQARDDRGNNVLHMCCGNGHAGEYLAMSWRGCLANTSFAGVLEYLLSVLPSSILQATNDARSPPLHWAILNSHLNCVKILVELPEAQGGGMPLLNVSRPGRRLFYTH